MADDATDTTDLTIEPEEPALPVAPVSDQFPAVDGTVEGLHAEVAQRSHDGSDEDRFEKVFVVGRLGVTDEDPTHRANAVQVLQEAMQRGLHPKGDVFLLNKVEHDEPLNTSRTRRSQRTELRYGVQVVPASVDHEPESTVSPSTLGVIGDAGDVGDSG